MPTIHVTTRNGAQRRIDADTGQSLMRTLRAHGVDEILALCGGGMSCGTCHVYVAGEWLARLAPASADEDELLALSDVRRPGSRLSCQIAVTDALDGLAVTVAPED